MEKQFNGIVEVNGKNVRYTACIAERFSAFLDNDSAIACAVVIDTIGKGRVKEGQEVALLQLVMTSNSTLEEVLEYIDRVKAPRKPREMSEETKRKNYEKQLAKLKLKYAIND